MQIKQRRVADGGGLPFEITVHDGEEDLQEQVDGVDQHRQEEQPSLSRHHLDGRKGFKELKGLWEVMRCRSNRRGSGRWSRSLITSLQEGRLREELAPMRVRG